MVERNEEIRLICVKKVIPKLENFKIILAFQKFLKKRLPHGLMAMVFFEKPAIFISDPLFVHR